MPIRFRVNREKALEALVFIASKVPGIDEMHAHKVLYFADKEHLNKYGRPIIADTYIRMGQGPVASFVRDVFHQNSLMLTAVQLQLVSEALSMKKMPYDNGKSYIAIDKKRDPNLDVFSKSDIACLADSIKKYSKMPFAELSGLSKERPYKAAANSEELDYSLFIDETNPAKDAILRRAQEYADFGVL
jgi:hypothetical protein